jgi:hypothetical protein
MMMSLGIKFGPNKPASPHLNGKVERSQRTYKTEFYATIVIGSNDLDMQLAEWQHYYNWYQPHCPPKEQTPIKKYFSASDSTPFSDEVAKEYQLKNERIQNSNYYRDLEVAKLKRSL